MTAQSKKHNIETAADAQVIRNELLSEISALRVLFQEIMSRYQANVESEIVWCINNLSSSDDEAPDIVQNGKALKSLLKAIRDLKLKPKKGRLKDIRRMDKVITDISSSISE
jgi:hypothetical protein